VVYLYDGQKVIETRDGSANLVQQFIHGTQYIDELVMVRVADKGDLYVHQDANWNVIGLTDLGGSLVERYDYTPYGEVTVYQETGFGDYDGDGDVDSTDRAAIETGGDCLGGSPPAACAIMDFDFDGNWDSDDRDAFDNLPQGLAHHPGLKASGVDQPFAHQGLLFEPEIRSYQNRARQYDPMKRRFVQRDPLSLRADPAPRHPEDSNTYRSLGGNPVFYVDPRGLTPMPCTRQWLTPWQDCDFWLPDLLGVGGDFTPPIKTVVSGECDDSMIGGSVRTEEYGYWTGPQTIWFKWMNCPDHCNCVHRYIWFRADIMVQRGTIVAQTTIDCDTHDSGKCCEVEWNLEERDWHVYKVRVGEERFNFMTMEQCCSGPYADCD
jgi:RHS repeat-associated protein